MKRYRIIKKVAESDVEFILLNPPIHGDEIYEFDSIVEAENKLNEIKDLLIYENIQLLIVEIEY